MINIADQLHAATADGVLADSKEIYDEYIDASQYSFNRDIIERIDRVENAIADISETGSGGSESGSTEIDEDEIDAIINGVDTAAPYITFYSEAEGETETAYRYTEGDVSAGESELGVSHTCFSRVDGQRFYLREGVWVDANGNASASYTGNIDVYASLTAESPIGTAEPHGFTFYFGGVTNL